MGSLRFQVFPTQAQLEHFVRFEVQLLEDVANFHTFTRIQNTIHVQVWIRKTCGVELNRETNTTQRGDGVLVSNYTRALEPSIPFCTGKSFIRVFFFDLLCWLEKSMFLLLLLLLPFCLK